MGEAATMREAILDLIREYRNVSFAELSRRIDGFKGDLEWMNSYGWVLWAGISQEAVDAINSLMKADEIHMQPTTPLVYLCDGVMLKLPVAKRAVKYKNPHWCPIVFNPGPPKQAGRKSMLAGAP
jgi:hypothetical protein